MRIYSQFRISVLGATICGWLLHSLASPLPSKAEVHNAASKHGTYVDQGSEQGAFDYYRKAFTELGLNPNALSGQQIVQTGNFSMATILDYAGYNLLLVKDLEKLPSATLRGYSLLRNQVSNSAAFKAKYDPVFDAVNITATRYFSPKITDVSGNVNTPTNFGWRKLVVIAPLPNSKAWNSGVRNVYFLFNTFQGASPQLAPFVNEAQNNQVIVEREPTGSQDGNTLPEPLYFFVFGPASSGGKLITFLTASFDAQDPAIGPAGKYYVPNACADCHGGVSVQQNGQLDFSKMKLNFIDTDHILDRVMVPGDFDAFSAMSQGALFDVGKLPGTDERPSDAQLQAYKSLVFINNGITNQNSEVDRKSFQTQAAARWLRLHEVPIDSTNTSFHQRMDRFGVFDRVLKSNDSDVKWSSANPADAELLPLLNQYCYRCHSSLRYSVFDKSAILNNKSTIGSYLDNDYMPQDRKLPATVKNRIKELVNEIE